MITSFTNPGGKKYAEGIVMKSNPVGVHLWRLSYRGPAVEVVATVPQAERELRKPRGMNG